MISIRSVIEIANIHIFLLFVTGFLLILYLYGVWSHGVWKIQGIPGPPPLPLLGNSLDILKKRHFHAFVVWRKQYGNLIGIFQGVRPSLVVYDLDFIREVLVKKFSSFMNRHTPIGIRPIEFESGLLLATGLTWKRQRSLMTAPFAAGKIKLMTHYIKRCSSNLCDCVERKAVNGDPIYLKQLFGAFALDVIAGTAFGLETNSLVDEGSVFITHCKMFFEKLSTSSKQRISFHLWFMFPAATTIVSRTMFKLMPDPELAYIGNTVHQIIKNRKAEANANKSNNADANEILLMGKQKKTADLLQMLVDAERDATSKQVTDGGARTNKYLTTTEMVSQGIIIFLAGYETTATTLQFLLYNLTIHPAIQQKVYNEIMVNIGEDAVDDSNLSKLKYLDMVIRESLRMFPTVMLFQREATEEVTVKGVTIPAGGGVWIPVYEIMHDKEFFEEPELFCPERFDEQNRSSMDPMLFDLMFGYGPRQCIGMRLALVEIKYAVVYLLRRFRFVRCSDTPHNFSGSQDCCVYCKEDMGMDVAAAERKGWIKTLCGW